VVFVVFSTGLVASGGSASWFEASSLLLGRDVDGGGEVLGESEVLLTPLKIPNERDSLRASRDPSLSSPSCANPRILKSSAR
jgi:hypothetical protein